MPDLDVRYRCLHPDDAQLRVGDRIAAAALPTAPSALLVLDDSYGIVALVNTGDQLRAGTELVVLARRHWPHHLASAVDVEVTLLVLAAQQAGQPQSDQSLCDATRMQTLTTRATTQASMQIGLALACVNDGTPEPATRLRGPLRDG